MTTLSALIEAEDSPPFNNTPIPVEPEEKVDPLDELLLNEPIPPPSKLGKCMENLCSEWTQMLGPVVGGSGPHPGVDNIREQVEFSVKGFKDACLEMNGEMARVGVEWRLKNQGGGGQGQEDEVRDLEMAIQKQKKIMERMGGK